MTITVPQTATTPNSFSGNFGSNVAAGDTVFLVVFGANGGGSVITSASPLFGGSPVTGAAKLTEVQSSVAAGSTVYTAVWMLPNVAGGASSFAITVTNGGPSPNLGLIALDVAGLGTSPALDQSSTNSATSGTAVTSLASGTITQPGEIVIGSVVGFGMTMPGAGAPWTELTFGGPFIYEGYQIVNSGSFTYAMTAGNGGQWAAQVATIKGPPPAVGAAPPLLGGGKSMLGRSMRWADL